MSIDRRKKLLKRLSLKDAHAAVISRPADICYLTGAWVSGYLVLSASDCNLYISSVEFEEQHKLADDDVNCAVFSGLIPWSEMCQPVSGLTTALDTASVSIRMYKEIENRVKAVIDVPDAVLDMRAVKDADEISVIREACGITEDILRDTDISSFIGKSEKELAGHLLNEAWRRGTGASFVPVVACGKYSAYPHHIPSDNIIERGWLKIDFGIRYKNYCSDLTRTYILDKFIDNCDSEKLFSVLNEAQNKAAAALRPHASCSDIYETARKHLSDSGIGDYFIHGLGHGVGLEVHEKPYLRGSDESVILPGMTVTIEPGFYMLGKGGMRIEDVFLVTEEGSERLTRISQ